MVNVPSSPNTLKLEDQKKELKIWGNMMLHNFFVNHEVWAMLLQDKKLYERKTKIAGFDLSLWSEISDVATITNKDYKQNEECNAQITRGQGQEGNHVTFSFGKKTVVGIHMPLGEEFRGLTIKSDGMRIDDISVPKTEGQTEEDHSNDIMQKKFTTLFEGTENHTALSQKVEETIERRSLMMKELQAGRYKVVSDMLADILNQKSE